MWPIGHVAVAYLAYVGTRRARSLQSRHGTLVLTVCFAGLIPDVIDKPLSWRAGLLPTGRSLAHSLLVLVPVCLLGYLLAHRRGRGEFGVAVAVGAITHPLVDALPRLWRAGDASFLLWPYLPVEPYEGAPPGVIELLTSVAADPYFLSEFVLFALALGVWRLDGSPGLPSRTSG